MLKDHVVHIIWLINKIYEWSRNYYGLKKKKKRSRNYYKLQIKDILRYWTAVHAIENDRG